MRRPEKWSQFLIQFSLLRFTDFADQRSGPSERHKRGILPVSAQPTEQRRLVVSADRHHPSHSNSAERLDPATIFSLPSAFPLRIAPGAPTQVTVLALHVPAASASHLAGTAARTTAPTVAGFVEKLRQPASQPPLDTKPQHQLVNRAELDERSLVALIVR